MGRRTLMILASILIAATGTALIWVYVQNAEARARSDWQDTVTVLQATATIDAGAGPDVVRAATRRVPVPRALVPSRPVSDARQLVGHTAVVGILAGQLLQANQFDAEGSSSGIEDGYMAVTVNLPDPNRVAGLLHPDQEVTVYLVKVGEGKDDSTMTQVLLPRVRVLAVGNTTVVRTPAGAPAQLGTQGGVPAANVTLQVDTEQAKKVIGAANTWPLWFSVLGGKDSVPAANDSLTSDQLLTSAGGGAR
jgi:pilus assembly protein CpaB